MIRNQPARLLAHLCFFAIPFLLDACGGNPEDESGLEAIEDGNCYAAIAGHPTATERTNWVREIATYAREAEQKYGVPAAAIVAMTALEGGYGWTRTALNAKNPFGYKYNGAESAGYRGYYSLTCQPPEDPNNKYIVFSSNRDAVLFVSAKLATLDRSYSSYKTVTDAYVRARRGGVNVTTAVNNWINGIADEGYNYNPTTYKANLKRVASQLNTYAYSSSVQPLSTSGNATAASPAASGPTPVGAKIGFQAPANGQTVYGNAALSVTPPAGTTLVKFFSKPASGGNWYQITIDQSAPFGVSWATAGYVPNGSYILRAEAWNGSTYIDLVEITVKVAN